MKKYSILLYKYFDNAIQHSVNKIAFFAYNLHDTILNLLVLYGRTELSLSWNEWKGITVANSKAASSKAVLISYCLPFFSRLALAQQLPLIFSLAGFRIVQTINLILNQAHPLLCCFQRLSSFNTEWWGNHSKIKTSDWICYDVFLIYTAYFVAW